MRSRTPASLRAPRAWIAAPRLLPLALLALGLGAPLAPARAAGLDDLTYQSTPFPFVLEDEVSLYDGSEFDTTWIPADSPLQIRFQILSEGGAEIEMEGVGYLGWPEGLTGLIEPVADSGIIVVDAVLSAITSIRFNVAGYTYESEIDRRGIAIEGEGAFTPFLMSGDVPDSVSVLFEGATNELLNYSYNVFTGVSVQFTTDLGPQATTVYDSPNWYLGGERVDAVGERAVFEPLGEPVQPVEAQLVGHWVSSLDLVLNPVFSVCVDLIGCFDLVDIDIPIPLAGDDFEQMFAPVAMEFPLPVLTPPPAVADFGTVEVGQVANVQVPLSNVGLLDLQGGAAMFGSPYFVVYPSAFLAAPGTTDGLVLTFEPQASGDFDGTLVLESNDPMQPRIEIQVIGTAVDPDESDPNGTGGTNEDPDGRAKPTVIESEIQGCGCASTRADRTGGALLGAIGLAGLLWRRRRA
ncbi:MAG: hypothetical protein RL071_4001 [Pseudomonadota bacterium]